MVFMRKAIGLLLPPLLGVGLAVGVPGYLLVSGQLNNLSNAVMVGSSIVVAEFTLALWWATREQAAATTALMKSQTLRDRYEAAPLIVAPKVEIADHPSEEKETDFGVVETVKRSVVKLRFQPLINIGKYGALIRRVELLGVGNSTRWKWRMLGSEDVAFPILPGAREPLDVEIENKLIEKEENVFFSLLFSELNPVGGDQSAKVLVRFDVVYGGSPTKKTEICFGLHAVLDPHNTKVRRRVFAATPVECPDDLGK